MNHLVSLPNQEGFQFVGVDETGAKYGCEVRKNAIGLHSVYSMATNEPVFMQLIGWEHLPEDE